MRHVNRVRRADDEPLPLPAARPAVRLQTARDVIDLLEEQVNAVRADESAGVAERARAVGFLAGVALRAIEAGDLADRLEALERALKRRAEGNTE